MNARDVGPEAGSTALDRSRDGDSLGRRIAARLAGLVGAVLLAAVAIGSIAGAATWAPDSGDARGTGPESA
jgi:hypothetical protein